MFALIAALVLYWLPVPPDRIMQTGFEGIMFISTERPDPISWAIHSTNSNAALVTSASYLNDGKVSTATRFTYDAGTQTTATITYFAGTFTGVDYKAGDLIALAFLCPKTAYVPPVGAAVFFQMNNAAHVPKLSIQDLYIQQFNNGSVGVVGVGTVSADFTGAEIFVGLYNNLNGVLSGPTWATPGQTLDIGEIYFGKLHEFKTTLDPQSQLVDPTTNRRSHSNQAWALYGKPYKSWTVKFTPMVDVTAFDSSSADSFDKVRYALTQAKCALFLPRIYTPGASTIDRVALNQLACLGRVDSLVALAGMTSARRWTAGMTFSESPP